MRTLLRSLWARATALVVFFAGGLIAPMNTIHAAQDGQAAVPVKKVVLYSSGVGYFEHSGAVKGNTKAELLFKTNQINDILKSMVFQDLGGGKIGTIVYPSQDPLSKTLRSFQIDITKNPSLAEILNQVRGAKITIVRQGESTSGTILGVEKKPKPVGEKQVVDIWVVNLITNEGIRSVPLELVHNLQLEDAKLQKELEQALAALAQARDQDKKPVVVQFLGEGERQVRLAYVVESPIWKTSYRLVLAGPREPALLQGWAIVENQTDNDWNDIQLSLVSGRPVSFIQELYPPLYINRPVVKPELYASLTPQTYESGMEVERREGLATFGAGVAEAPAAPAPKAMAKAAAPARRGRARDRSDLESHMMLGAPLDLSEGVESAAAAEKLGELFQYTVGNVSLPRQRSAMIPIIADPIEVERLSIYNARVLAKHPLRGARIKNTSGKHLLQGPITVFDANAYAGDAKIDNVPPGQDRLLSYAIDLEVAVNSTHNRSDSSIRTGKIVRGVLHLVHKDVFAQEYLVENKADEDRVLIIEYPFRQGWKLASAVKPIETTDRVHRFKDTLKAGGSSKLEVVEEFIRNEEIALLPARVDQILYYSRSQSIAPAVREVLTRAIRMKQELETTRKKMDRNRKEIQDITQEQERIRSNMGSVDRASKYYTRLLEKLNEQESQIEGLQKANAELQNAMEKQQAELEAFLMSTNVG